MGALFPNRGIGWPGGWSSDRLEQVTHLKNWTYVAVKAVANQVAQTMPNLAYVRARRPGGPKGYRRAPQHVSLAGRSFLTVGSYYRKALSVVQPEDELEPLEHDHPLRRLLENPNPVDSTFDLLWELDLFLELTGVAYLWAVPNGFGVPCELWVIPSHWVWPRTGGGAYVDMTLDRNPYADQLVQYYEIRPWGGMGSAGILRFPPTEVIPFSWKSPLNKVDGYSPLAAAAQWIDTEESISRSRWSQFMNQATPSCFVELGPEYEDMDDDDIARVEAKFAAKYAGEYNTGRIAFGPPGSKVTPLGFNPTEMSYFQSEEQIRDMILSTFGVPKAAVGINQDMTFGSILATLAGFCTFGINPRLSLLGQRLTKFLAPHFDGPRERVKIWWDDCAPADPAQVNADIAADAAVAAVTPNEVRQLRGRPPYEHGGDDPLVSGPGGLVPLPLNTGEDLTGLAALVPVLGDGDGEGEPEGGGLVGGSPAGTEPPSADAGIPDALPDLSPAVEEPNGPPSKDTPGLVSKARREDVKDLSSFKRFLDEFTDEQLDGILVYFNENDRAGWIDVCDWGDEKIAREVGLGLSRLCGDEARIIWQNEGGKPGAGWIRLDKSYHKDTPALISKATAVSYTGDPAADAQVDYIVKSSASLNETISRVAKFLGRWEVEKQQGPHTFACAMLDLRRGVPPDGGANPLPHLEQLAAQIPDEDLAADGREADPHVTVKYGLHTPDPGAVRRVVQGFGPVTVTLGRTAYFAGGDASIQRGGDAYDVVYVEVLGDDVRFLNKLVSDSLPHTDTHPEYVPHVTLAYVRPGLGEKYAGRDAVEGLELTFTELDFADQEGAHTAVPLEEGAPAKAVRKGSCKPGETAAQTGCTPAEGGGGGGGGSSGVQSPHLDKVRELMASGDLKSVSVVNDLAAEIFRHSRTGDPRPSGDEIAGLVQAANVKMSEAGSPYRFAPDKTGTWVNTVPAVKGPKGEIAFHDGKFVDTAKAPTAKPQAAKPAEKPKPEGSRTESKPPPPDSGGSKAPEYSEESYAKWKESLSPVEKKAAKFWGGGAFDEIKQVIRNPDGPVLDTLGKPMPEEDQKKYREVGEAFKAALERAPRKQGTYYRGLSNVPPAVAAQIATVGNVITHDAPASWTDDEKVAQKFAANRDTLFGPKDGEFVVIRMAGKGVPIKDLVHIKRESEYVVPHGQKFKVTGVERVKKGKSYGYVVTGEEVE